MSGEGNNLRVGMVVVDSTAPTLRGVVRHVYDGKPRIGYYPPGSHVGDAEIWHGDGWSTVTNNADGHWVEIPPADQNAAERVRSFMFTWTPHELEEWEPEWEWQLLRCLLADADAEERFGGDWPDTYALALAIADNLDVAAPSGSEGKNQ